MTGRQLSDCSETEINSRSVAGTQWWTRGDQSVISLDYWWSWCLCVWDTRRLHTCVCLSGMCVCVIITNNAESSRFFWWFLSFWLDFYDLWFWFFRISSRLFTCRSCSHFSSSAPRGRIIKSSWNLQCSILVFYLSLFCQDRLCFC